MFYSFFQIADQLGQWCQMCEEVQQKDVAYRLWYNLQIEMCSADWIYKATTRSTETDHEYSTLIICRGHIMLVDELFVLKISPISWMKLKFAHIVLSARFGLL